MPTGDNHLSLILTSINGRSSQENAELIQSESGSPEITASASYLKERNPLKQYVDLMRLILKRLIVPAKDIVSISDEQKFRYLMKEVERYCSSKITFNELVSELPQGCAIFHVNSLNWSDGPGEAIRMFSVDNYCFQIGKFPELKFTPEDCQDYITLKYSSKPLERKDIELVQRLQCMDITTQLNFWVDGYPVHKGPLLYWENLNLVDLFFVGPPHKPLMYIPPGIFELYAIPHEDGIGPMIMMARRDGEIYLRTALGMCVPDFSCCHQKVMIQDQKLRRQIADLPFDQRMREQAERFKWIAQKSFPNQYLKATEN